MSVYGATLGIGAGELLLDDIPGFFNSEAIKDFSFFSSTTYAIDDDNVVYESADGLSFSENSSIPITMVSPQRIIWSSDYLVVQGQDGSSNTKIEIFDTDLILFDTLTFSAALAVINFWNIAFSSTHMLIAGGKYYAPALASRSYFYLYRLSDGNVTDAIDTNYFSAYSVACVNNVFVAYVLTPGSTPDNIRSTNGLTWTALNNGRGKVIALDGQFINFPYSGSSTTLQISTDGLTWENITPVFNIEPTEAIFDNIGKNGDKYVMITASEDSLEVYESDDLIYWVQVEAIPAGITTTGYDGKEHWYSGGGNYVSYYLLDENEDEYYRTYSYTADTDITTVATITSGSYDFAQSPL